MHPGPLQKTLNKMPVLEEFRFQQHHAIQDDTSGESNVCFGTQKPYLILFSAPSPEVFPRGPLPLRPPADLILGLGSRQRQQY